MVLSFFSKEKYNNYSRFNISYLIGIPFGLEQYHFWAGFLALFSFSFLVWIFYADLRVWWITELPKWDEDLTKRKSAVLLLIYRIRSYSYKGLLEIYSEKLYEAFLLSIIFVVFVFHQPILYVLREYLTNPTYRKKINTKWQLHFKSVIGSIIKTINFYLNIIKRILKVFLVFRPFLSWFLVEFSYSFKLFSLIITFVVSPLIKYIYVCVLLLPVFVCILSVLVLITFSWLFVHKKLNNMLFSLLSSLKLLFPRLSISVANNSIISSTDFYHKPYQTFPIYARLKSLVGTQIFNFWNSNGKDSKRILIRRKNFIFGRQIKRHDYIYHIPCNRYLKYPGLAFMPFFHNNSFKINGSLPAHRLYGGNFNSQFLLPKLVSSKLSLNTLLAKNFLLKKDFNPFLLKNGLKSGSGSLFLGGLLSFNNSNISSLIPTMSNFYRKTFFISKYAPFSLLVETGYKHMSDTRSILALSPLKYKKTVSLASFSKTDIINYNFSNFFYKSSFASLFLRKNKIKFISGQHYLKSRKLLGVSSIKIAFLIYKKYKKNKEFLRKKLFLSNSFYNSSPRYAPKFVYRRNSVFLKKCLFFIKNAYLTPDKILHGSIFLKKKNKIYLPNIFVNFFFNFLKNRSIFNLSKDVCMFMHHTNTYNIKFYNSIKINSQLKSCSINEDFVPLAFLNPVPWWLHYSFLFKNNYLKFFFDSYEAPLNKNLHKFLFSVNLSGYALGYLLSKKIAGIRPVLNKHLSWLLRKKLFLKRRRIYRYRIKKILRRKSYELRFFFDHNLYSNSNDLKRLLSFKNVRINSNILKNPDKSLQLNKASYFFKKLYLIAFCVLILYFFYPILLNLF